MGGGMNRAELTLTVAQSLAAGIAGQAGKAGVTPESHARILLEAAFAARCGRCRPDTGAERDLDEQVRLAFACAGQADTAAIARTIGIPEARVMRILAGWRRVLGEEGGETEHAPPPSAGAGGNAPPALDDKAALLFVSIASAVASGRSKITNAELETELDLSPPAFAARRRRLVAAGLIETERKRKGAGRGMHYRLTDRGRAFLAEFGEG